MKGSCKKREPSGYSGWWMLSGLCCSCWFSPGHPLWPTAPHQPHDGVDLVWVANVLGECPQGSKSLATVSVWHVLPSFSLSSVHLPFSLSISLALILLRKAPLGNLPHSRPTGCWELWASIIRPGQCTWTPPPSLLGKGHWAVKRG